MAALDFPAAPTVGQKYPDPDIIGVPSYVWDGEKWTTNPDTAIGEPHVKRSGDTMTGNLQIGPAGTAWATLYLNKALNANGAQVIGALASKNRWAVELGNSAAETGSNTGSDFSIDRFDDSGAYIDSPLAMSRQTGYAYLQKDPVGPTGIATKQYVDNTVKTRTIGFPTGTAYTLVLADAGKIMWVSNPNTITLTVPTNATVAFPIGTQIEFIQEGLGSIVFTPASGVSFMSEGNKRRTMAQYSGATMVKLATDIWWIGGNITA